MRSVRAVILDWAGTTIDYGSIAPIQGFLDGFISIGETITMDMARKPMGLPKLDHVRAIAKMLPRPVSEENIQRAYAVFVQTLMANLEKHCDIKDFAPETAAMLRARGIMIGSTTGYTAPMMAKVIPIAAQNGYSPDLCITPEDVGGKGRPWPYMIWENMKRFEIADPREVVKVGDTLADIAEGKSAGCWTVGVIMGSSEMGLDRAQAAALSPEELEAHKRRVRASFYKAGADYIIDDLSELGGVIGDIQRKLAQSEPRKLLTPGPLTTRQAVKNAMLADHCTWDEEYKAIAAGVMKDITLLSAGDDYDAVLLQGSGTYAVEAMISSLTAPDEKILFAVNGEYGRRMTAIASQSGRTFGVIRFDEAQPVDPRVLNERLTRSAAIGAVAFVHCETTTGVINPLEELAKVVKRHGKKCLVDAMSSFGAYEIDMDGLGIDALASSANKCLEGLPGLSFVIARKALLESSKGNSPSHSLDLYDQYKSFSQGGGKFRFTSPTNVLLALRQALDDYKTEGGLPARRARYMENHARLVDGLSKLGFSSIVAPEHQSYIITTFDLGSYDFNALYAALKSKGFIIYPGKLTSRPSFRLGNIGDVYPSDMDALVDAIGEWMKSGAA